MTSQNFSYFFKKITKLLIKEKWFFVFFSISFSIYALWLIAFFPGIMTFDSISQWTQSVKGVYDDAHPFFHTMITTSLRLIWDSPAAIALLQITLSSLIISYALNFFIKEGVAIRKVIFAFLIFITIPSIGIYNITLWKDVFFAQFITILALFFVRNYQNKLSINNINIILIALLTILIANMRHNGIIYILFVPLLYISFKLINLKKALLLLSTITLFYLLINILLLNYLHVTNKSGTFLNRITQIQIIGNILSMGLPIGKADANTIEKIMPLEEFRKRYNCSAVDYLLMKDSPFDGNIFTDKDFLKEFDKASNNIIIHNIPNAIADRICLFSHLIGLGDVKWAMLHDNTIMDNPLGIKQVPQNNLRIFFNDYLEWSRKYPEILIFWGHFLYILIYIYYTIKSLLQKKYALLGFIILITINIPVLFIFGAARDFRYLYMIQFALPFVFLIDDIRNKKA